MKRDYLTTFAAEAVVIVSYLLTFRLIAIWFTPSGFGEYALSRRALSLLAPLAVLTLDVAIARLLAYAVEQRSAGEGVYVSAALVLATAAVAVTSAVLLLFRGPLAELLFGSSVYASLITPLPLLLAGTALHGIAYGTLRGRFKIQRANLLLILDQGLVPVLAVLAGGGSVPRILALMGAAWIVVSLAFLPLRRLDVQGARDRMGELLRFGVPRIPGDLLQLALFALPGILVAHATGIAAAGIVAFGISALRMIGSALTPISFVLLPVASRLFARGAVDQLRGHVLALLRVTIVPLLLGTIAIELLAGPIISVYLGKPFLSGTTLLRVVMAAALPWGLYVTLKSVVDARHFQAINARNTVIAFVVFLGLTPLLGLVLSTPYPAIAAFTASLYLLAALTLLEVYLATRGDILPQPVTDIQAEPL
jgi:O-antigen/teichoic acid export membrane protein